MRAIGIDPGTGRCGFGIVDKNGNEIRAIDYGIIETPKEMELIERIHIVYQGIKELITLYKPQVMGVETLYFNKLSDL